MFKYSFFLPLPVTIFLSRAFVVLFFTFGYPGQVTWQWLISSAHAGAPNVKDGEACASCHPAELMGRYSVEHETRAELRDRWKMTVISGFIFVIGIGLSGVIAARRND